MKNENTETLAKVAAAAKPERVEASASSTQLTVQPAAIQPNVAHARSGPNSRLGSRRRAKTMLVSRLIVGVAQSACIWTNASIHHGFQPRSIATNASASHAAAEPESQRSSRVGASRWSASAPTIIGEMNADNAMHEYANAM